MFNKKPAVKEWSHQACFSLKYKQVDVSYHRLNCKPTKCKFKSKKKLSKVKKKQNFKSKKKQNYLTKSLKKLTYKFLGNQQKKRKKTKRKRENKSDIFENLPGIFFSFKIMWPSKNQQIWKIPKYFWHDLRILFLKR